MKTLQRIAVLVAALLLTLPAVPDPSGLKAQDAETVKIVIQAPSSARVGELVRLDASKSIADSFKWVLIPESVDFETCAEGKKAFFSARTSGEYQFVIGAARGGEIDLKIIRVNVVGPPEKPQDASDVAGHIQYWLWDVHASDESREALAKAFERVSQMQLSEPSAWIYETKRAVDEALGADKPQWEPFLKKLGAYMGELGMTEAEEHKAVWEQIAAALKKGL